MEKPWRLAESLVKLRDNINQKWPLRSKASDGTIGDSAHASRVSDHNPWVHDHSGQPVVTAMDITNDPAHGPDGTLLSVALITDARVKYVIFAGRIWKARTGRWEPYRGVNPHNHHVHVSVKAEPASYDNPSNWSL